MRTKPVVPSESRALGLLITALDRLKHEAANGHTDGVEDTLVFVIDKLRVLQTNAASGLHENPGALVLYGNPPTVRSGDTVGVKVGPSLGVIEELNYRRSKAPAGYYFHVFGRTDALCLGTLRDGQRIVLIVNAQGKDLWGEQ